MFRIDRAGVQFSLVTFVAAMLALYLAMCIDLQRPYWAMMTVYIVSQPLAAAVRSKALQRLLGTLLGATAALVMVVSLVNAPVLLCLAMALWVGGCLAVSLLDRSPRSYIMMLAGYTAAIIGFSSVNEPTEIFNLTVARSEEIVLGILCATVAHSLWFPRPVGAVIRGRIALWLGEAEHWALDILEGGDAAEPDKGRIRLAAAATDIHLMATHLPFDISHLRETTQVVRALHDRILMLIPVLSSLFDRLATLRGEHAGQAASSLDAMARVAAWIRAGAPAAEASALQAKLAELAATATTAIAAAPGDWQALRRLGFLTRLQELSTQLGEARSLLRHLDDPLAPLAGIALGAEARPLHSDLGLALLSGAAASVAMLIACTVWIGLGWAEGGASATLAAILCCLFGAMDDPAPNIKVFGHSLLIGVPLAAIYLFIVFPAIDSFPMLVLALAPTLLVIGVMMVRPATALLALITLLNMCNSMAIQERFSTDFASFVNVNLSQFFGVLTAVFVTRSFRSMSADASARRLLRQTWKTLASLARSERADAAAAFASRMVDRLGLLAPRLAKSEDRDLVGIDALRELRVGMDLVTLQGLRAGLPASERALVERLLGAVGAHYAARSAGCPDEGAAILPLIDEALSTLPAEGARALTALLGLRGNLFPQAPACLNGVANG